MTWDLTDKFPNWGETGEYPTDGFFYEGGDQVNEKHLDALWNGLKVQEDELQAALTDIDSDKDGIVDETDTVTAGGNLKGDLFAVDGEVIWDESNTHIPQNILENDSITVNAGDGVSGATLTLGQSASFDVDVADFAGSGLADDGSNNLTVSPNDITISDGDGINGATIALGGAASIDVDVSDFAGDGLDAISNDLDVDVSDFAGDGLDAISNDLNVDVSDFAGKNLQDDGANNLEVVGGSGSGLDADSVDGLEPPFGGDKVISKVVTETGDGLYQSLNDPDGIIIVLDSVGHDQPGSTLRMVVNFIDNQNNYFSWEANGGVNQSNDTMILTTNYDSTSSASGTIEYTHGSDGTGVADITVAHNDFAEAMIDKGMAQNVNSTLDHVQIFADGGNINSGTITLYSVNYQ